MKLVISEKPSVAQSLAKVVGADRRCDGYLEGNGYLVSWCIGHLVELADPEEYDERYSKWRYDDLPILPQRWKYRVSPSTRKQFEIIRKLMARGDVDSLVCATDAGREGELIFRLVYHQCGCRKPFERLWISSMEDAAIREGFENLKPGTEYDALYEAALCREHADWIVGINATRLFSCLYGQTLNVGRVMTPTLAMVVMRDAAIRGFRPEPFYTVRLQLDGFHAGSERLKEKPEAEALIESCRNSGVVTIQKVEQTNKLEKAPALYDLTTLQRDANRQLGFTAQQTLDYLQALDENTIVTYPRTDSRDLTDDMAGMLPELVQSVQLTFDIQKGTPTAVNPAQVINSAKVTDHHAIIPTKTALDLDLSSLPSGEKAVLQLIAMRLVCAVSRPYTYCETILEAECAGHTFKAKGRTVLDAGWKLYAGKTADQKNDDNESGFLPVLEEGTRLSLTKAELKEGQTTPPRRFTEDLLLQAMENASAEEFPDDAERKGIGTPATRAGIIEKLVQKGYVERKGDKKTKYLIATDKGTALVTVVPEQIQSPSMTADWEEKLMKIEHGEYAPDTFMAEISGMISALVKNYEAVKGADVLMKSQSKVIGRCPACGCEVAETPKGWFCTGKNCRFGLWKDNNYFKKLGKQMNRSTAEKLVKEGRVYLKGCRSAKTGCTYNAAVLLSPGDNGRAEFELKFENGQERKQEAER